MMTKAPIFSALALAIAGLGSLLSLPTNSLRAVASLVNPGSSPLALSLVGTFMLILADGLRRRSFSAWTLTIPTLAAAGVYLVVADAGFWSILYIVIVLAILALSKAQYFRSSQLFDEVLTPGWSGFLITVLSGLCWTYLAIAADISVWQHAWWDFLGFTPSSYFVAGVTPLSALAAFSIWRLIIPKAKSENSSTKGHL
jgi:phosphatidylglycerol lysyltransferase